MKICRSPPAIASAPPPRNMAAHVWHSASRILTLSERSFILLTHSRATRWSRLAQRADILIHEATTRDPSSGHTTPRQAGEIARRVGAGRLILVHFSPRWTMPMEQALAEVRAGGFDGPAEIGQEQQVIEL